MRQLPVFAYGTLRDPAIHDFLLSGAIEHRRDGTARGRWIAVGGAPAAVFRDGDDEINGELLYIRPTSYDRALRQLDSYETSLYQRIELLVSTGPALVKAFAYEWTGDGTAR